MFLCAVLGDCYDDFGCQCGHGQQAFTLTYLVVVFQCALVQGIGKRVFAFFADICLGAGHIVGSAFSGCPAVTGYRHGIVRQSRSVINLRVCCACQRDLTFRDCQRTILGMNRELTGDVIAISILNNRGVADCVGKCCDVSA